jgi:anti-sigma B factor antagonist
MDGVNLNLIPTHFLGSSLARRARPYYVFFMDSEKRGSAGGSAGISVFKPSIRKLDILTADEFSAALLSRIEEGARLILDLTEVEFIDSSGLGKIIGALRSLRDRGGDMRICGAQPTVSILFDMVRLHEIVGIDEDAEASEAALSGSGGPAGGAS